MISYSQELLAITYIKNNSPTKALLSNITLYKAQNQKNTTDMSHLRILCFTVYIFLHKKEQSQKWEKKAPKTQKKILMGYDSHIIYKVYIKDQNKVIQIKNIRIFKDFETKLFINLLNYKEKSTFKGFFFANKKKNSNNRTTILKPNKQKVMLS